MLATTSGNAQATAAGREMGTPLASPTLHVFFLRSSLLLHPLRFGDGLWNTDSCTGWSDPLLAVLLARGQRHIQEGPRAADCEACKPSRAFRVACACLPTRARQVQEDFAFRAVGGARAHGTAQPAAGGTAPDPALQADAVCEGVLRVAAGPLFSSVKTVAWRAVGQSRMCICSAPSTKSRARGAHAGGGGMRVYAGVRAA